MIINDILSLVDVEIVTVPKNYLKSTNIDPSI